MDRVAAVMEPRTLLWVAAGLGLLFFVRAFLQIGMRPKDYPPGMTNR